MDTDIGHLTLDIGLVQIWKDDRVSCRDQVHYDGDRDDCVETFILFKSVFLMTMIELHGEIRSMMLSVLMSNFTFRQRSAKQQMKR